MNNIKQMNMFVKDGKIREVTLREGGQDGAPGA